MSTITKKSWSESLAAAVVSNAAVRGAIQDLCLFAMAQAGEKNFTFINDMVNSDFAGADARAMVKYFEGHCDVKLPGTKNAAGKYAFTNNGTRGFVYVAPNKVWWEYKPTTPVAPIDPIAVLLAAVRRIEGAIEGKGKAVLGKGQGAVAKHLVTLVKGDKDVQAYILGEAMKKVGGKRAVA